MSDLPEITVGVRKISRIAAPIRFLSLLCNEGANRHRVIHYLINFMLRTDIMCQSDSSKTPRGVIVMTQLKLHTYAAN